MKKWDTWFLFEDKETGKFKNQSCFLDANNEKKNVDECIERFHHIIRNKTNPYNRGVVFTNHNQIVDLGLSEEDENRLFLQYKHNSVYQMLGRWIQFRTGEFGDTVTGDENTPIPLEGLVTHKRMNFVFGWVHKLLKGTQQYEQATRKFPHTRYRVNYGSTSQFSLGALNTFWKNYGFLYRDAPFADTYTIAFKQLATKDPKFYTDYAPVKANKHFELDSPEGHMAIGSLMYFFAHRPSTQMCNSDYKKLGVRSMVYRDPETKEPKIKYFTKGQCATGNFKACLLEQKKLFHRIGSTHGAIFFEKQKSKFVLRGENEDHFRTLGEYALSKCPMLQTYKPTEKELKIRGNRRIVN